MNNPTPQLEETPSSFAPPPVRFEPVEANRRAQQIAKGKAFDERGVAQPFAQEVADVMEWHCRSLPGRTPENMLCLEVEMAARALREDAKAGVVQNIAAVNNRMHCSACELCALVSQGTLDQRRSQPFNRQTEMAGHGG